MTATTTRRDLLDWHLADDGAWDRCLRSSLAYLKKEKTAPKVGAGKSLGLLFFNPSLRTRTSMEVAAAQLGAHVSTITPGQGTWQFAWDEGAVMDGGEAEHVNDAVAVLSRYYDALGVRLFASMTDYEADRREHRMHQLARAASVPLINLESAFHHPCQALADATALRSHFGGDVQGRRLVLAWTYHPKALPMAVPNSALLMAARLGMDVTVARPDGYALDASVMALAQASATANGGSLTQTDDLDAACQGADVIYAKAWGGPLAYADAASEQALRARHRGWRIQQRHLDGAPERAFMHCLPVRRNVVVDDDVLDGAQALHLLQAECRLHAQKAILEWIWSEA